MESSSFLKIAPQGQVMQKALHGQVAVVTGGSRNIGRETALALARRGADVIFTYREKKQAAERVTEELTGMGVRARALQVDLTGTAQLDRFVSELTGVLSGWEHSNFNILINSAGTLRLGAFHEIREDDLDHIYQTNYKSVFFLTQRLAPLLSDGGRIVNLGSGTARIAFAPLVSYGPFKAALQSLTLYLASYFGKRGITVNAVAPGGLDDDFNGPLFAKMPPARDFIISNTAVERIGVPVDIGEVIAFLCTPEASFVSGAVIPIDGGYHL
jgi:NAD(P)-dependent dehydrogenase (short-subunit alcohol dehydrogenase family)